jgi:hypothetical protein
VLIREIVADYLPSNVGNPIADADSRLNFQFAAVKRLFGID